MKATLVGDIHGKVEMLYEIFTYASGPVIQIGDLGFAKHYNQLPLAHQGMEFMVIAGNHDDYDVIENYDWYLGDYGLIPGCDSTFFIRGAYSVDKAMRYPGIDWWENEELSYEDGNRAIDLYEQIRPQVMLTHCAPNSVINPMFGLSAKANDFTSRLLEECLTIHIPKMWVFGHYHVSRLKVMDGCEFICLREGESIEVDLP